MRTVDTESYHVRECSFGVEPCALREQSCYSAPYSSSSRVMCSTSFWNREETTM